ncbi:hypothetical protein HN51_045960 [Arachis hypogaea]
MGSQNSTINPKGAAATIETEVFSVSVRSRLSRKFEEFKSRKNINKFEEKSLLYDDGAVNEDVNDEEEETVKLLQQPAKTSIDDESVDESIESASSENSNALLVEMEPLTMATSKKKRLGKIKFGNMKNLNVKNIKNRIINPLLSSAQDRKLFTHSPK